MLVQVCSYKVHSISRYGQNNFIERFYTYKSYFQNFLYLICSQDFLDISENYFYKIRDDILNYINNKILSINKYYFNSELYKDNFYIEEQINNEIYKIIDNINNFFNEIKLNEINLKSANLALEILTPYNEQKEKYLDSKYNEAYYSTRGAYGAGSDFVYITKRKAKRLWRRKTYYYNCPHINNIYYVIRDLSKTNLYLKENINKVIQNFINKFDNYLNNYVSTIQALYNDLYNYYEEKNNNHGNIEILLNDYENILNETIFYDSNQNLSKKYIIQLKIISKI